MHLNINKGVQMQKKAYCGIKPINFGSMNNFI